MRERVIKILEKRCSLLDYKTEEYLVTGKKIDSIDFVSIITDIEDEFDIVIDLEKIEPCNFDSVTKIVSLIEKNI